MSALRANVLKTKVLKRWLVQDPLKRSALFILHVFAKVIMIIAKIYIVFAMPGTDI